MPSFGTADPTLELSTMDESLKTVNATHNDSMVGPVTANMGPTIRMLRRCIQRRFVSPDFGSPASPPQQDQDFGSVKVPTTPGPGISLEAYATRPTHVVASARWQTPVVAVGANSVRPTTTWIAGSGKSAVRPAGGRRCPIFGSRHVRARKDR